MHTRSTSGTMGNWYVGFMTMGLACGHCGHQISLYLNIPYSWHDMMILTNCDPEFSRI